jgi:hypothetical protein
LNQILKRQTSPFHYGSKLVEFFDPKTSTLNNTMKSTIDNTKDIIGTASKGARDARKELVKRFLEMKQNQEKQLLEFKTNIRSRKDDNKYRMYRTLC